MKSIKIILAVVMIQIFTSLSVLAQPATSLDELYARVVSQGRADSEVNLKRLEKFKSAVHEQQMLLASAMTEFNQEERQSDSLNLEIADNEREIASLQALLSERLGNFGELFGVTRQVAGDTRAHIADSIISIQFPNRAAELESIASSKSLPSMEQLRILWTTLLQEQMEQGETSVFTTAVSSASGVSEEKQVMRLGPFAVVADGHYLSFDSSSNQLAQLYRQPSSHFTSGITDLSTAAAGETIKVAIDPSRGLILSLLVQSPSLLERFKQGGLPGYVVSVLALIGLFIGVVRFVNLWVTAVKVKKQMHSKKILNTNPLGRIFQVYRDYPNVDIETLELKLEDVILKEVPKLERGLSTIKVLAAVSPLIGLLGTVVGMILTFQAITLWGTGDPKIMAGGISQALVTTVQGLVAAIPLLILHSLTSSRARLLQQVLEEQSAGLIAMRAEKNNG